MANKSDLIFLLRKNVNIKWKAVALWFISTMLRLPQEKKINLTFAFKLS